MSVSTLVFDGIVLAALALFISAAARKGFVRTIVQFIGFAGSMLLAGLASRMLAPMIFERWISPTLYNGIVEQLRAVPSSDLLASEIVRALDGLPSLLTFSLHIDEQMISKMLAQVIDRTADGVALKLVETLIAPTIISLISVLCFSLVFGLSMFLVRRISYLIGGLHRIPLIGPVNTFLGGVIGFAEGILFLMLGAAVIRIIMLVTGNSIPWLTPQAVEQTYLLKLFFDYNPLVSMISGLI